MLPSKGFFKKNDCPFFEKGLCVRPHCHFRHRKKVVNDHSPIELIQEEEDETQKTFLKLMTADEELHDSIKKPCSSNEVNDLKAEDSVHDPLFSKLVNQSDTYEKISRHIPCAYIPTPQTKNVEPKNKSVNSMPGFSNSEKSLELITKARTLLQNYCAKNIKRFDDKCAVNSEKKSEEKNETCHEEQSHAKIDKISPITSCSNDGNVKDSIVQENEDGLCSNRVPYKETEIESKFFPECSKSGTTLGYISSKEKSGEIHYEPNPPIEIDEFSSLEFSNTPEHENFKCLERNNFNYNHLKNKTDASLPNGNVSLIEESQSAVSELDFISSEIEMMKKLLNEEDDSEQFKNATKEKQKLGQTENQNEIIIVKKIESERECEESSRLKRDHRYERHKSKAGSSHSSSSYKLESTYSSSSSKRHQSSSSKHRSSKKHSLSDHLKTSSGKSEKRHKKKDNDKIENESDRTRRSKILHDPSGKCLPKKNKEYQSESDNENEELAFENQHEDNENYTTTNNISGVELNKMEIGSNKCFDDYKAVPFSNDEDFEDDPVTVEKQCLEIFNSYSQSSENKSRTKISGEATLSSSDCESVAQVKKRTAHSSTIMSDHSVLRLKTTKRPRMMKSARETMYDRYKTAEKSCESQPHVPNHAPILGFTKPSVRIAAVSNIQQMLLAKKAIQEKISQGMKVNERTTVAHTITRGLRIAHVPTQDFKDKPVVTEGSKQIPRMKRQFYLDKLLVETHQIYPTKNESAEEAKRMEHEIFRLHSGSLTAYHAAFVSLLMKTRKRVACIKGETSNSNSSKPKISHVDVLSGGKKNFSVIKTKKVDMSMLSDKHIYDELLRCKLSAEELKENGFPMPTDRPGYATCFINYELSYNEKYQYIKKKRGNRRLCIRCSKEYEVDPITLKQYKEGPDTCSYHPGKKKSGGRNWDRIYNCCNSSSTEGCTTHVRHITDCNDYENYPNCVQTMAKEGEAFPGIFALDCEMVYTRLGSELARVTVVNLKKEIIYDTLVKPKHPIDCYNTCYSGIDEKKMEGVETSLKDVQAVLLSMFSNKTILIGHSLDSDLRALHLIHETVVDTSVVYKNTKYYPYKYSLKELCAKKISKIIQENIDGHDSSEDAIAALELMLQYVEGEAAKYDSLESYEADRGS